MRSEGQKRKMLRRVAGLLVALLVVLLLAADPAAGIFAERIPLSTSASASMPGGPGIAVKGAGQVSTV